MTLIKSISGIRGTIGGAAGANLTPIDAVEFAAAYAGLLHEKHGKKIRVVTGRDARPSGPMLQQIVNAALQMCGVDVIDLGMATTPTVEMAVPYYEAQGGIILTASHNPVEWNALKILDHRGEFISAELGQELVARISAGNMEFSPVEGLGTLEHRTDALQYHLDTLMARPEVNAERIAARKLVVVVDAVNSIGGIAIPALLERLGVEVIPLHCEPHGQFAHNPEPLAAHLVELSETVRNSNAHMGITVDPDVDRLAFVCEDGSMFGEEYTLVAVAEYLLTQTPGHAVSNLSSTRALADVCASIEGCSYSASAVGEVNVVKEMKATSAVIGGEGNGGVIWPDLHYGRDALAGVALFLSHYSAYDAPLSEWRKRYPQYLMAKEKIQLEPSMDVDALLEKLANSVKCEGVDRTDGVKFLFSSGWVHLRKSNTEPIIRMYAEAPDQDQIDSYVAAVRSAM